MSGSLLDLVGEADADESVVGLELLQGLGGVVDEGEAGALSTTELGAETEDGDLVLVGLVELGELVAELILGDVGAVGVEDVTVGENDGQYCRSLGPMKRVPRWPAMNEGWMLRKSLNPPPMPPPSLEFFISFLGG